MAEKGFGVKEVNLIGASGTPTITSPNNLNLNANNVAISTNVSIGGTLSVTGNVSVGGTLTYEDVTNIDSVGLITARSGIVVGAGKSINIGSFGSGIGIGATYGHRDISVVGFSTLSGGALVRYGGSYDMEQGPNNSGFRIVDTGSGYKMQLIYTTTNRVQLNTGTAINLDIDAYNISLLADQSVFLSYNNSTKLQTTNTGITVTGDVGAGTFTGSGASLTTLNASQLTSGTIPDARFPSTLPAVSGANLTNIAAPVESPVANFTITSSGSSAYRISGGGLEPTANNPDIYLIRGQKYRFNNTTGSAHPFQFRLTSSGSAYTDGITGDQNGVQFFTPDNTTPSKLFYICTLHSAMIGNIYVRGANGGNENVGVTTFSQTASSVAGVTVTSQGLHHYEEGTFTPFLSAASSAPSVSYGAERGGKYTRIGDVVFYSLGMSLTSFSGGSGNVYIGGFPYVGTGTPGWDGAHVFRDCSAIGLNSRTNTLGAWMETSAVAGYPILYLQTMSSTSNFGTGYIAPSSITTGRITVHGHYKVG